MQLPPKGSARGEQPSTITIREFGREAGATQLAHHLSQAVAAYSAAPLLSGRRTFAKTTSADPRRAIATIL